MKSLICNVCCLLLVAGCGKAAPEKVTCEIEVTNVATQEVENCWINAGRGELDIGILIPNARKEHGDFPAVAGSPVDVRWKFEGTAKILVTTNVLGHGVRKGEQIEIFLHEGSATTNRQSERN